MMAKSKFYAFISFLASFLQGSFDKSKTCVYLSIFASFLTDAFSSSLTYKLIKATPELYPQKLWDLFDAANAKLRSSFDVFNPVFIFPLIYFGFVSISSYRVSNLALISIFIGISFFVFGIAISRKIKFREFYLEEQSEKIAGFLIFVGALALVYDLYQAGSIPLFNPAARRQLSVTFTMLASIAVPGGILAISIIGKRLQKEDISIREARMYALVTMLSITFLISLLGYRTQTIVALLGCIIAMYYMRIMGLTEILVSFFLVILTISSFGYYRAILQGSSIGFFDVIGKRVGLTLSIYDYLINRFWEFGANKGSVLLATFSSFFSFIPGPRLGPRTIVAHIFGVRDISMTSTLLGTVVLDFGILGIVLFTLLLGFVIGLAYRAMRQTGSALSTAIFALLLAYALVGIETGLVDFNVAMFFIVGFLILWNSR